MSLPRVRFGVGLAVLAAAAGISFAAWKISHDWPFSKPAITRSLQQSFGRDVQIGRFRETWFPPGCIIEDVRLLHRIHKELPPLLSAKTLVVRSSWTGLLARRVSVVILEGLRITIPPPDASGKSPVMPDSNSKSSVSGVGEVRADDAVLKFLPRVAGAEPTVIHIHQLIVDHVTKGGTVSFHCSLKTDKPRGELAAVGSLGPWKSEDPAQTRISGRYDYLNADLGVFHGLRGALSSKGAFDGALSNIKVNGSIDVPKFHVEASAESVHLTGNFNASVDSHTADTVLEKVEAHVGKTTILASGNVSGGKGTDGKTARVQLAVDSGRVEDLLNYFSQEKRAAMTGAVRLRAYAELPPGEGFLKKILLTGDFEVSGARFTSAQRQEPVNRLGESALGEKKQQQEEDRRNLPATLKGHVAARNGIATLTNLRFDFAGSDAAMSGQYDLLGRIVNLHGTLRTEGSLSETSTGLKEVVLKVATPFFKKQHTTVVPFTISGSASSPAIGLDWKRKTKL